MQEIKPDLGLTENQQIVDLENEINLLQHKIKYLHEKDITLKVKMKEQNEKLEKARESETMAQAKETRMIEKAKRLYNIDFSNKEKLLLEA